MNSQELLAHYDNAQCWPKSICSTPGYDINAAYRDALAVRDLRIARGEKPRGYQIGFNKLGLEPNSSNR
jgi:2-oxo-3-hexenedioate decarboxylase